MVVEAARDQFGDNRAEPMALKLGYYLRWIAERVLVGQVQGTFDSTHCKASEVADPRLAANPR